MLNRHQKALNGWLALIFFSEHPDACKGPIFDLLKFNR